MQIYRTNNGWNVAIVRDGVKYTRLFSDSIYGSNSDALYSAQEWRVATIEKLGPSRRGIGSEPLGSVKEITIDGARHWQGEIRYQGKRRRSKFSVRLYGQREARLLAKEWLASEREVLFG